MSEIITFNAALIDILKKLTQLSQNCHKLPLPEDELIRREYLLWSLIETTNALLDERQGNA